MQNTVPREHFYACRVVMFCRLDGNLFYKNLPRTESNRLIIFADGRFFDVKTGDEIMSIDEINGVIVGEIFENTMYIEKIQVLNRELTDYEYTRGQQVFQEYLLKKKLIEEKKLIPFKQKRLY